MIERKGFVRKYSTAVRQKGFTVKRASGTSYRVYPKSGPATVGSRCVKDLGKPGKGAVKTFGPLRQGELTKYGYAYKESEEKRHAALRRAVKVYGALGVYKKLDVVAKYTVRTTPTASKIFEADSKWIRSEYGKKERGSTRKVLKAPS